MAQLHKGHTLFRAGESVPFQGQYVLVDGERHPQNRRVTLKEGELFPELQGPDNLFYMLDIELGATSTDNEIPIEKAID